MKYKTNTGEKAGSFALRWLIIDLSAAVMADKGKRFRAGYGEFESRLVFALVPRIFLIVVPLGGKAVQGKILPLTSHTCIILLEGIVKGKPLLNEAREYGHT